MVELALLEQLADDLKAPHKSFRSVLWTFGKLEHDLRSTEKLPKPCHLGVQVEIPSFSAFVLIKKTC